jgi:elongation factor G
VPIQLPIGAEDGFEGVIDLVAMKAVYFSGDLDDTGTVKPIPDEHADLAAKERERLIEAVADADDAIAEIFLEEREPEERELKAALRRACIDLKIVPVACGAALRNKGIRLLLDGVGDYLPSPADLPPVEGIVPGDAERTLTRSPKESDPLAALVFKVAMDEGRKIVFLRIFSGVLKPGQAVFNSRAGQNEKIARLFAIHAHKRERLDSAPAGNIVVAAGLKLATTGDTLCSLEEPILLERIDTYEPVIFIAIEPKTQAAKERLDFALGKVVEEDPTFRVREDEETGQTLISGMGELHLEVVVDRLRREYGVQASVGKPQVVYRETIGGTAEAESTFQRELKDADLFGEVACSVRPLPRGSGNRTATALPAGDGTPPAVVETALAGLTEAAQSGPDGYPLEDIEATLLRVGYKEEAQPEIGVRVAAMEAFHKAVAAASPFKLEPIMAVEVVVPEDYLGAVIGDLRQRRAQINDLGDRSNAKIVDASVPLRMMFGYSTDLRSLSKGRATFTMSFQQYD